MNSRFSATALSGSLSISLAREAHTAFFNGLFPHVRNLPAGRSPELAKQIENLLSSERVNKRTDDDKTLILASRAWL